MIIHDCYNCGAKEHSFYAKENGFDLVKCDTCGLLYVRERPDDTEISQAHKQGKHRGASNFDITGTYSSHRADCYRAVLTDLFPNGFPVNCQWLDVGCGHGEFMEAVLRYGQGKLKIRGSEPNIHKQNSATKRGLDVTYFDIESHTGRYSHISLLNVFSHLPDPPSFVSSLKSILVPGGELILETGDTAHFPPADHYRPFYLPDHLSFASEKIVTGILERLGFEVLRVCKYPYPPVSPRAIAKEVAKIFLPGYRSDVRCYLRWKHYAQTDMYIRARLP